MFILIHFRLLLYGVAIWIAATGALRIAGQHLLYPGGVQATLVVFAVSFPLMAFLVRRLCRQLQVRREEWPAAAISFALPTLLLDPFSSVFFPVVFPNMSPEVAGVFAGWMLWCCGGALLGISIGRRG